MNIMTEDFQRQLLTVVVDKGALALVLALAGLFINKYLEKFKSSLSWSGELLKQRMTAAKDLVDDLKTLHDAHLRLVMNKAYLRATNFHDFNAPRDKYLSHVKVAELLFSSTVIVALDQADRAYCAFLPDASIPELAEEEREHRQATAKMDLGRLTEGERLWQEQHRKELEVGEKAVLQSLQAEFPRNVRL